MLKTKISIFLSIAILANLFLSIPKAGATVVTAYKGYRAELVDTSFDGMITAQIDKAMTIEVEFKNTGTQTWYNDTAEFVTLDVSEPFLRESSFYHEWWRTWDCPAWLLEKKVAPGEVGTFRFAIAMPSEPGLYTENFRLAATNTAWIPGGELEIKFNIVDPNNPDLNAKIETAGETSDISTDSTNTEESELENNIKTSDEETEEVADPRFNPTRYSEKTADEFEKLTTTLEINKEYPENGPDVRIGLYSTEKEVVLQTDAVLEIHDTNDKILMRVFDEAVTAEFNFKNELTSLYDSKEKLLLKTDEPIRFTSSDETAPIEIVTNKTNTETWQEYTLFKGIIELTYTDDETFWIINELSMEDYLKGSAECGNGNPSAYLEAMAIAERSYAVQRLLNNGKHSSRGFDLVSHTGDQVYRGYSRELTQPDVVSAVEKTNGLVVTYDNEVVITPYFAYSNGWTRTWTEAWGGSDKPWLQPVYVPVDDDGNGRFGHGVGMSATGARDMARNDYNFEEIIRYFYTDTKIHKVY